MISFVDPRRYEVALAIVMAGTVAAILGSAWWETRRDRDATLGEAAQLALTLASAVSGRFEATFRDAANAATSAAMLVEQKGGFASMGSQGAFARELKRESWDETSTARLVAVSPEGQPLAASAGAVAGDMRLPIPATAALVQASGLPPMQLGTTETSLFDGRWVLPLWVPVGAAGKDRLGWIRAEIRSDHLENFLEQLPGSGLGSLVIMRTDGFVLVRAPHDESVIGQRRPGVLDFLQLARADTGTTEFTPAIDGRPRVYAWRRLHDYPVVIAVGLQKDRVLAQWRSRSASRWTASVVLCLAMCLLAAALAIHIRRLGHARAQAQELEHRYWEAMNASSSGVAIADLSGTWVRVNRALAGMLGYSPEELLALQSPRLRTDASPRVAAGEPPSGGEAPGPQCLEHRSGHRVWFDVQSTVLKDRTGQPTNIAFHFQDVTARKLAEDALRDVNERLEHTVADRTAALRLANEDLEAFTYSVAHDLRAPVDRLRMFAEVLEQEVASPDEKLRRRIDAILRQGRTMSALIEDLLAFARAGKAQLEPRPVDMNALVADVRKEAVESLQGREVAWHVQPLPAAEADPSLLREVWRNLIGNALKYTGKRDLAAVEIGAFSAEAGQVGYFIKDNGAGFDEAFAHQLFLPFKRLHAESEFPGTGVGLAIVHRILLRHGGRIWAQGTPGGGATLYFTLPARKVG